MNKKPFNIRLNLCSGNDESKETNETNETNKTNDNIDITELQKQIIEMQNQVKTLSETNNKLTQYNQELFLKVTGNAATKDKVDKLKEYKEYVGDNFFNSLSNKQQNLLITILEGEDE